MQQKGTNLAFRAMLRNKVELFCKLLNATTFKGPGLYNSVLSRLGRNVSLHPWLSSTEKSLLFDDIIIESA